MDLFDKIALFEKKAQATAVVDSGIKPHYVRQVAGKIVNLIKQNQASLPPEVTSGKPNSLIDLIGDYLGGRFTDTELDARPDQHLLAIKQLLDKYSVKYPASKSFFDSAKQEIIKAQHFQSGVLDSGLETTETPLLHPGPSYMPTAEEEKKMMGQTAQYRMKILKRIARTK